MLVPTPIRRGVSSHRTLSRLLTFGWLGEGHCDRSHWTQMFVESCLRCMSHEPYQHAVESCCFFHTLINFARVIHPPQIEDSKLHTNAVDNNMGGKLCGAFLASLLFLSLYRAHAVGAVAWIGSRAREWGMREGDIKWDWVFVKSSPSRASARLRS